MTIKEIIKVSIAILAILLFQILVLNQVDFRGFYNPYIYPLAIILFPSKINKSLLLLIAFALGLTVDIYESTGGLNAMILLTIAFIKDPIYNAVAGKNISDNKVESIHNVSLIKRVFYLSFMFFIFHLGLYGFETFKLSKIMMVLFNSIISTLISVVFTFIIWGFIPNNQN